MHIRFHALPLLALAMPLAAQVNTVGLPAQSTPAGAVNISQVRIVRLSLVRGNVELDRGTDRKLEPAFVNLPIVAGMRLQTLDGLAEVEFEDNSSVRLTPNTLIEFPVLGRAASGTVTTGLKLVTGSLYVSLVDARTAEGFSLTTGSQTITLAPSSHLRVDVAPPTAKVAVFHGNATITDAAGSMMVAKGKAAAFDMASTALPASARRENAAFDSWDKNEVEYHKARSSASAFAASPFAYGASDLGYYGSFADSPGCGSLWRPYLASAAWQPYGSGVWSWYPGAGYSWVSPYPWGWMPYHTGSWEFCQSSSSWGWRPGGSWNGLINEPTLRGPIEKTRRPVAPPAPRPGQSTLLGVNLNAMPVSRFESGNSFVFHGDSAGLGVPRGVFSDLHKVSEGVAQHGFVAGTVSEGQAQRAMIPPSHPASGQATGTASTHSVGAGTVAAPAKGTTVVGGMSGSMGAGSMSHGPAMSSGMGSAMPAGGSHH